MIRSEIEKILDECIDLEPYENAKKYAQQSLEALITKSNRALLDRVERELPGQHKGIQGSLGELPLHERGRGFNACLDQTKATIDRIRGEM